MSEIEKMYENAGIEKEFEKPAECVRNPYITCEGCMLYDDERGRCNNKKEYPPFTAEKQLELIKWLMVNNKDYQYDVEDNKYWFIIDDYRETKYREFDEALAELINLYWQDLTEEKRKQIAEILRG